MELYTNRIVVRLHREGKFLIPIKDVADVQRVDNPFKTFCQPVFMHTRATQMTSSVYIQSKSKGVAALRWADWASSFCAAVTLTLDTRRSVSDGYGAHG